MRRNLVFIALCLLLAGTAFAQDAEEIQALLAADSVTYEQAAWFVLKAADLPVSGPAGAFQHAVEQKWLTKDVSGDQAARLDGIALLVMQSFDLKGGILYRFAKNAHYAYREMVYKDIIQGRIDPTAAVSGDTLLYIVNRVFYQKEAGNQP